MSTGKICVPCLARSAPKSCGASEIRACRKDWKRQIWCPTPAKSNRSRRWVYDCWNTFYTAAHTIASSETSLMFMKVTKKCARLEKLKIRRRCSSPPVWLCSWCLSWFHCVYPGGMNVKNFVRHQDWTQVPMLWQDCNQKLTYRCQNYFVETTSCEIQSEKSESMMSLRVQHLHFWVPLTLWRLSKVFTTCKTKPSANLVCRHGKARWHTLGRDDLFPEKSSSSSM